MEHSLLRALQLAGLIVAVGGPVFILGLLSPACRRLGPEPARDALAGALSDGVARWVAAGALTAGLATFLDLFVQAAEIQGTTPFGGVELALAGRFATGTTFGQLALARIACLVLVAATTRLRGPRRWGVIAVLGAGALGCTALASHAAAQSTGRSLAIASQVVHLGAAAAWIGVLAHLLAARATITEHASSPCLALLAAIVRRASPVALAAAALLLASGVYAAMRHLHTPAGLVGSAYGLTLSVKMVMVLPMLVAGFINHRIVRPNLLRPARAPGLAASEALPWVRRFGRMLELEVTAGVLVVTIAGIVGSISPPGEDGTLRLTPRQLDAVLTPALPRMTLVDPLQFVGVATRTVDDLRYAELMHNWSGVFVMALGLLWLGQGLGGRNGVVAARAWPLLLVPLAVFIAVFADPEVWVLRAVTFREAIGDPSVVEHHVGAVLVLVLAWLGWRDRRRPPRERPLGPALPLLMIAGSLLLLGHSHASVRTTEELGTLINVQHGVLGALGLLAGTVRWLSLRGVFPERPARILWPLLVTVLGLFLTFCYREIT
jgi:putative copper resistance protein D